MNTTTINLTEDTKNIIIRSLIHYNKFNKGRVLNEDLYNSYDEDINDMKESYEALLALGVDPKDAFNQSDIEFNAEIVYNN